MFMKVLLLIFNVVAVLSDNCYFNAPCTYQLFSSKTPYDSVRGDIREALDLPGCRPAGIWSLHRHGNRNPGSSVTAGMKTVYNKLAVEIRKQFEQNIVTHCMQDFEDCLSTKWNSTIETSSNYLTDIGYEELFNIGKRIRQKFNITQFPNSSFYFRPTNEQRTITSAIAFVNGLTDGTALDLEQNIDKPWKQDDVIRPYENCIKYQEEVKNGNVLTEELAAYDSSTELFGVSDRVQKRMNIDYQLTVDEVYHLYEYCRFHRSWSPKLKDPWCAFFTDEDLEILEYRDDVRHYYRNGYGSTINVNLGAAPLKDFYENFEVLASQGGERIISYFSHDTMFEMMMSALGLFKDSETIHGSSRHPDRLWRTSEIAAFAANFVAVLYRCDESDVLTHRVQIFINEKTTNLCSEEGCSWEQFVDRFQVFANSTIDFCSTTEYDFEPEGFSSGYSYSVSTFLFLVPITLIIRS